MICSQKNTISKLSASWERINDNNTGSLFYISGESGIGKTFIASSFIDSLKEEAKVFNFEGSPVGGEPFSCIFDGIIGSIPENVGNAKLIATVLNYCRVIPGLSKYVPDYFKVSNERAKKLILNKSGFDQFNLTAYNTFEFITQLSEEKPTVLFFDDAQWVDQDSWAIIEYIVRRIHERPWLLLLLFNNKADTSLDPSILANLLKKWGSKNNCEYYQIIRHEKSEITAILENLLGKPAKLAQNHLDVIYNYSSGIPRFIKSVVDVLLESGLLSEGLDCFKGKGNWDRDRIRTDLEDSIEARLTSLYKKIPHSQSILEIASAIGLKFRSEDVDSILKTDTKQALFLVEELSNYIRYIFNLKHWEFDHSLIQYSIYRSLGNDTPKIHRLIAEHLETRKKRNYNSIAYHYDKAGIWTKSVNYRILHAKNLLSESMFDQAIQESRKVINTIPISGNYANSYFQQAKIIESKSHYYLSKYSESVEILKSIIEQSDKSTNKAECYRWLGKCYLNLDSIDFFRMSIQYLGDAIEIYKQFGKTLEIGECYSDLVIAHAHNNDFSSSKSCFLKAEKIFASTNSSINMARLQRKNVIFMDSTVSTPILLAIAETFYENNMPHERLMALVNAATKLFYMDKLDKAIEILQTCREESIKIGGFGLFHIYNNLLIAYLVLGNYEEANKAVSGARGIPCRAIEAYIFDLNKSVLGLYEKGPRNSLTKLEHVKRKGRQIGEDVLYMPAVINLASAYNDLGRYSDAISLLETQKPIPVVYSNSDYKNKRWIEQLEISYSHKGLTQKIEKLKQEYYNWFTPQTGIYTNFRYALIDLQFWSD